MLKKILLLGLILVGAAIACSLPSVQLPSGVKQTPAQVPGLPLADEASKTPFLPVQPSKTIVIITPTPKPISVGIFQTLPEKFRQNFKLPTGFVEAVSPEQAEMKIQVTTGDNYDAVWIYALAAPFPTILDELKLGDLQLIWKGDLTPGVGTQTLYVTQNTKNIFELLWGKAGSRVKVTDADQLSTEAWQNKTSLAIIPFEAIEPRWKILSIDGQSPLLKPLNGAKYPLAVRIGFSGTANILDQLRSVQEKTPFFQATNRDEEKLSVVVLTGVTALVRATANRMENKGVTYPGRDIRDWLTSADITHISNEVSFSADCPTPDPSQASLFFCSHPKYLELFTYIGADVIEMSGNHVRDFVTGKTPQWGIAALINTLDLYRQKGFLYYAGGRNQEEARQPVKIERNGNKFAFIGCNIAGPDFAWAKANEPGAAQCDFDYMETTIRQLKNQGYQVIATFQHYEYYTPDPRTVQKIDFRRLSDAGAIIVSGSQAHAPQAMEFYKTGFIHYGLGNLFFDQMDALNTRQEFIDRHIFYNGQYLGVQLLTAMLEDYAAPRPMNIYERKSFLTDLFAASGW